MKEKKLYTEQLKDSLLVYKCKLERLNKCLCSDYIYDYIYGDTIVVTDKKTKRAITQFQIPKEVRTNILINRCGRGRARKYIKKQNNNEYAVYISYTGTPIIALISLKDYLTAKIKTLEEMVNYDEKR